MKKSGKGKSKRLGKPITGGKPEGGYGSHGAPASRRSPTGKPNLPTGQSYFPDGRALGDFDIKVPKGQRK